MDLFVRTTPPSVIDSGQERYNFPQNGQVWTIFPLSYASTLDRRSMSGLDAFMVGVFKTVSKQWRWP
jgi:hypothetical protein